MILSRFSASCVAILTALALAGCTIKPLHSTVSHDGAISLTEVLSSIDIEIPGNRLDQLVTNELAFGLSGGSEVVEDTPYRLRLNTVKQVRSIGIDDTDVGARSFSIILTTNYILTNSTTQSQISSGVEQATATFERVEQEFANLRSERDAEIRAARAIAQRLRQSLAIDLNKAFQAL